MFVLWILLSYLAGSIPSGYLIARKVKNIDIRTVGSGNIGTANIGRVLGAKYAAMTLFFDTFKGFVPVLVLSWLYQSSWPISEATFSILLACAAVTGHSRSVWIQFQGGKAVATGLGTMFALAFPIAVLACSIFLIVVWYSRYISLGSMVAALSVPLWMYLFHQPLPFLLYGSALAIFVMIRHRANIMRIITREEPVVQLFKEELPESELKG